MILSLAGLIEYYLPWPNKNIYPAAVLGIIFGLMFPVLVTIGREDLVMSGVTVMVVIVLVWQIIRPKRTRAGVDAGITVLGALYAGLLPSFLILTRQLSGGFIGLTVAVTSVWACDIAAYFVGKYLGKRKLAKEISPHKTVEGAIAGIIAGISAPVVFAAAGFLPFIQALVLGILVGVFAQVGDLIASTLKREVGIKDYSRTIPGHGGILDRFDGLFFVAPFIYFLFLLW